MSDQPEVEIRDGELRRRLANTRDGKATLDHLREIRSLDAGRQPIRDLSGVEHLANLDTLRVELADSCQNCSALAALGSLTTLKIQVRRGDVSFLGALKKLRRLSLDVFVEFAEDPVDLGAIVQLKNLAELSLSYHHGKGRAVDLSPLRESTALRRLSLTGFLLDDLSCLGGMTALQQLDLRCSPDVDYSPLLGLHGLTELKMAGGYNQVRALDLRYLPEAVAMTKVSVSGFMVADVSPVAKYRNLTSLALVSDHLDDIGGLSGLTQVESLDLSDNRIADIESLARMHRLESLTLRRNRLQDIRPLAVLSRIHHLDLDFNQVSDPSPLVAMPALAQVCIRANPLAEQTIDEHLGPLWRRGVDLRADDRVNAWLNRDENAAKARGRSLARSLGWNHRVGECQGGDGDYSFARELQVTRNDQVVAACTIGTYEKNSEGYALEIEADQKDPENVVVSIVSLYDHVVLRTRNGGKDWTTERLKG